jgi:hypothetical protein
MACAITATRAESCFSRHHDQVVRSCHVSKSNQSANDAEREAQIDEIIARLERLEVEAARLRQLAARLKAAREKQSDT